MANRRIIVQEIMSLDGFVADASGGLDFFAVVSDYSEVNQENLSIMASVETLLLGAKTYQLFVDFWPTRRGRAGRRDRQLHAEDRVLLDVGRRTVGAIRSGPHRRW